ncbi:hypothetical protein [Streptomyces sp. NPDC052535]
MDTVVIGTPVVHALMTAPGQAPSLTTAFAQALNPYATTETRA